MDIGVPRERRNYESRVGLTPAGVELLTAEGHNCCVESGAGVGAGFADLDYEKAGPHPQFREDLEKAAHELNYW
jgi:alanine dehydrogenase